MFALQSVDKGDMRVPCRRQRCFSRASEKLSIHLDLYKQRESRRPGKLQIAYVQPVMIKWHTERPRVARTLPRALLCLSSLVNFKVLFPKVASYSAHD